MIGDDREKEFVETGQFGVIEIAAQPPALAAAQGDFNRFQEPAVARFQLFGGEVHLGFGQTFDGRPTDQHIETEGEGGERE